MRRKFELPGTLSWVVLLGVLVFATQFAIAQSTATLRGTVTDQTGAMVPNATITARNQATGIERTTQSDSTGISNRRSAGWPVRH